MPTTPPLGPDESGKPPQTRGPEDIDERVQDPDPDPTRRAQRPDEHLTRIVSEDADLLRRLASR